MEEGVTESALVDHEDGVGETDDPEVVGVGVDPAGFVKEGEEVSIPLRREGGEFSNRCVGRVEVPDAGEEVVENDDEGGATVLKEAGGETGRTGGYVFKGGTRGR